MIDINKRYTLNNYNTSTVIAPVGTEASGNIISVSMRGGSNGSPTKYPFTPNEILYIYNNSKLIQFGYLVPDKEDAEDIYNYLRCSDWQNILSYSEIEDTILQPTLEKLQKFIDIEEIGYFERIYGVFTGLKNSDAAISGNVTRAITTRYKELKNKKRVSEIKLTKKEIENNDFASNSLEVIEQMKKEVAEKDKLIEDCQSKMAELEALIKGLQTQPTNTEQKKTTTTTKGTNRTKSTSSTKK